MSGDDLVETPEPQFLAAFGVALAATERGCAIAPATILQYMERRIVGTGAIGTSLAPLRTAAEHGRIEPEIRGDRDIQAYLGVDVGSVSTDLCLLSPEGKVLDGIYLRTRGDPVGVLREGLEILRRRTCARLQVLGTGTTGSGRHLAGKLLAADVVKNEITCQLLGAHHALPEVDTIFEIGGQDSKYVSVREGHIRDFVMNKICAAGTGSFLEEQGQSLGVSILEGRAGHPPRSLRRRSVPPPANPAQRAGAVPPPAPPRGQAVPGTQDHPALVLGSRVGVSRSAALRRNGRPSPASPG
jgi:activator of 2-hydroxyglutaryl-CoA dehydratase